MLMNAERANLFQSLETSGVPSEALARLAAMGITTLAELRDHWAYGNRQLIVEYLGESPVRMVSAAPARMLATRGGAAVAGSGLVNLLDAGKTRPLIKHARGVLVSAAERASVAVAPEAIPLATARRAGVGAATKTVSLIAKCSPIRDQKTRGTCVAFASVGFLEFQLKANDSGAFKRFAEQFVYWACKQADGLPKTEGTFVSTARSVLKSSGSCLGKTWKYNPLPIPGNESQGPPPQGATAEAKKYLFSAKAVAAKNPDRLREQLDAGKPVVLSVKTFPSWDYPIVSDTGEIPMPFPGDVSDGGHAICVVGYELNSRFPGGGAFLIRNSWGTAWAKPNGRFQPGYGTLFFEYIKKYGLEAYA